MGKVKRALSIPTHRNGSAPSPGAASKGQHPLSEDKTVPQPSPEFPVS